ncbi:hypothetical protein F66182_4919 [Fusarium sp. NRRL 66182]|nr:hypothetical protein F66182_4919 [Fusarium sp. NRRL 66182]
MDPISALSLAANIFQVISFTSEVITISKQVYEAGSTADHSSIEKIASHALSTSEDITRELRSCGPASQGSDDSVLLNLGDEAVRIAQELKLLLQKLREKGQGGKPWHVLSHTIMTMWKKEDVEKLEKRLAAVRDELQFHAVIVIQKKLDTQSLRVEDVVGKLDQQAQAIIPQLFNQFDEIKQQNDMILECQIRSEAAARQRHQELMGFVSSAHRPSNPPKQPKRASRGAIKVIMNSLTPSDTIISNIKDSFLVSLWFPTMQDREDIIHEAYKKTYEWLFCDPVKEQKPWANFREFLSNDGDIYWITGKAGSGKSTLTKFAVEHDETKLALSSWAGEMRVTLASFYFYYKGTALQKSEIGVLRALLHQILTKRPHLIEAAFPERYQACLTRQRGETFEPTYVELKRSFENALKSCPEERFIIVVDGLDEYDAEKDQVGELVDDFKSLSTLENVKFILTSRPWVVFEERFAGYPRLRLHELTLPDIKNYVNDKIGEHPRVQTMIKEQGSLIKELKTEIVDHSSGVFLWVCLVVRSLLLGLSNGDSVDELRSYFLELPTDLEDLYLHMWKKISKRYQPQVSRLLQILSVGTAKGARTSLLGLAMLEELDETSVYTIPIAPLAEEKAYKLMDSMELRISSRCLGLIEVHRTEGGRVGGLRNPFSDSYPNDLEKKEGSPFVSFIHRTVFEFVSDKEVYAKLKAAATGASGDDFTAESALLRLLILRIKTFPHDDPNNYVIGGSSIPLTLETMAYYALVTCRSAERASGEAQTRLMAELDNAMTHLYQNVYKCSDKGHWHNGLRFRQQTDVELTDASHDLLSLAVRQGLVLSVAGDPCLCESIKSRTGRPLLDYALRPGSKMLDSTQCVNLGRWPAMVELLVSKGASAGQTFDGKSLFKHFMLCLEKEKAFSVQTVKTIVVVLETMPRSGVASKDVRVLHRLLSGMVSNEETAKSARGDMHELKVNVDRALEVLSRMKEKGASRWSLFRRPRK